MKRIGVIGVGNTLRRDDGIGIIVLEKIMKKRHNLPKCIDYINGGTSYMNLIHYLGYFDTVVFIDAIDFNGKPGDFIIINYEDIVSKKFYFNYLTHGENIIQVINFSKDLGIFPKKIVFFGIQPKDVSFSNSISKELSDRLNIFVYNIINLLKKLARHEGKTC